MGLFKKPTKILPRITIEGIDVVFDPDHNWWEFSYEGTGFITFESQLFMPSREQLDGILSDVTALRSVMLDRLSKGWSDWDGVKMDDGESYQINLAEFSTEGSFEVSWSGGASWGDMGIEFTILNREILHETWGD